ncbi:hypothetical protein KCU65_g6128, partial [Aureobasidium melanogenum]
MPSATHSFGDVEYWNNRFSQEEQFDWLADFAVLKPWLRKTIAERSGHNEKPQILHIGCGSSALSLQLRELIRSPKQIHNVDYSSVVIGRNRRREIELLESSYAPFEPSCWSTLDLLSASQILDFRASAEGFDLIIDKSTSDAISCAEDVTVELPYPISNFHTSEPNHPRTTRTMFPLDVLAHHLAYLANPGCQWIVLSYSASRFSYWNDRVQTEGLPHPLEFWDLERHEKIEQPPDPNDTVHRPPVMHHLCALTPSIGPYKEAASQPFMTNYHQISWLPSVLTFNATGCLSSLATSATSISMDDLQLYTLIHHRYQVYDHSGQLPFSVVFGLCRRSPEDTDPRPMVLDTRESVLDVPYALANGLLVLDVKDPDLKAETANAIEELRSEKGLNTYLSLPSPVNIKQRWTIALVEYRYEITQSSQLASIFKPETTYELRIATRDLGIKWYGYGEKDELVDNEGQPTRDTEQIQLVSDRRHGRCIFTVVPSLSWPQPLITRLQLEPTNANEENSDGAALLRVSVQNSGIKDMTVQTRGTQRFLMTWGTMQPEEELEARPRIIDAARPAPVASLRIVDKITGTVVHEPPPLGPSGPGNERDPRPELCRIVTIKSGETLVRLVDISHMLAKLPDGAHEIHLEPRRMWWCEGDKDSSSTVSISAVDDLPTIAAYSTPVPESTATTTSCDGLACATFAFGASTTSTLGVAGSDPTGSPDQPTTTKTSATETSSPTTTSSTPVCPPISTSCDSNHGFFLVASSSASEVNGKYASILDTSIAVMEDRNYAAGFCLNDNNNLVEAITGGSTATKMSNNGPIQLDTMGIPVTCTVLFDEVCAATLQCTWFYDFRMVVDSSNYNTLYLVNEMATDYGGNGVPTPVDLTIQPWY